MDAHMARQSTEEGYRARWFNSECGWLSDSTIE